MGHGEPTGELVLLVDDDEGFRSSCQAVLQHLGYEVAAASCITEALCQYERAAPSVVLTDLRLGKENGLDLLKALHERDPGLPVVLITGFASIEAAREAVREGASDFLTKPFSMAALQDALCDAKARGATQSPTTPPEQREAVTKALDSASASASELPPGELLGKVLRSVRRQQHARGVVAALVELGSNQVRVIAADGAGLALDDFPLQSADSGLIGQLFASASPLPAAPVSLLRLQGERRELDLALLEAGLVRVMPLAGREEPLGLLAMSESDSQTESELALPIFELLCAESRAMLAQEQSLRAVSTMKGRLELMDRIAELRSRGLEQDALLAEFVTLARESLRADQVICYSGHSPETLLRVAASPRAEPESEALQLLAGAALAQRRPVLLRNLREAVRFLGTGAVRGLPTTALVAPMIVADAPAGVFVATRHSKVAFENGELSLLLGLAAETGLALESLALHRQARRKADEVEAISQVSNALSSTLDLAEMGSIATVSLAELTGCDLVLLAVEDQGAPVLHLSPVRPCPDHLLELAASHTRRVYEAVMGASAEFEPILAPALRPRQLEPGLLVSVEFVPLMSKSDIVGVLAIFGEREDGFSEMARRHLATIASALAVSVRNGQLYGRLKRLSTDAIRTLGSAIEAKDPYTQGHSAEVARLARALGQQLGLPHEAQEQLEIAGYLHDVGKIGIKEGILGKPGPLTSDERAEINAHPVIGVRIVDNMHLDSPILSGVKYHHERLDGGGYPDGLKGDTIPQAARILSVADTFDAIVSTRPYRPGATVEQALDRLKAAAGTQLDPEVVTAFCDLVAAGALEVEPRPAGGEAD